MDFSYENCGNVSTDYIKFALKEIIEQKIQKRKNAMATSLSKNNREEKRNRFRENTCIPSPLTFLFRIIFRKQWKIYSTLEKVFF